MLKSLNFIKSNLALSLINNSSRSYSTNATAATWDKLVKNATRPVVVDFYATWCPPCKTLEPALEKAIHDFGNADLVKVNVDDEQSLALKYNVSSIPHVMGFSKGEPIFQFSGAIPPAQIKKYLDQFKN